MNWLKILILLLLICCNKTKKTTSVFPISKTFHYTKHWAINQYKDMLQINYQQKKISPLLFHTKPQRLVVHGTGAIGYLKALELQKYIVGVSNPQYISDSLVQNNIKLGKIQNIGLQNELSAEKIYRLKPDLFLSYTDPSLYKLHQELETLGIKVLLLDDFEEKNPLARAEWIKLFGVLFDLKPQAELYFSTVEKNYRQIKQQAQNKSQTPPLVLTDIMYGDTWYLPEKDSYNCQLITDAGGQYAFANYASDILKLNFEKVYYHAAKADYWINASDCKNLAELYGKNDRYALLKPYKTKQVYAITAKKRGMANDYFEEGLTRPDLILADLCHIFHPSKTTYFYHYYQKLN